MLTRTRGLQQLANTWKQDQRMIIQKLLIVLQLLSLFKTVNIVGPQRKAWCKWDASIMPTLHDSCSMAQKTHLDTATRINSILGLHTSYN